MTDTAPASPSAPPEIREVSTADIAEALRLGWRDFTRAPAFGLFFSGVYVLGGMALFLLLVPPGNLVWALPLMVAFPLIAPFAAVGLYEVSRRLEAGADLPWGEVLGVVLREKNRQIPSMSTVIIFIFLVWVFIGHMIFALFMGLQVMTNVSTSFEVFFTANGLSMLAVGSAIGAGFAFVLFSVTVVSLPMLLDRELDFVTAMIASFSLVTRNFPVMMIWAGLIVASLAVGMLPFFLGLFVALPVLGHATWHLYRRAVTFADAPA